MLFSFPEGARWNADRQAVEFGVEIGEYRGVVTVPRRVFQRLLPERPTPERCVEAYYLHEPGSRASRRGDPSAAVGRRGRERRDQRAGLALTRRWETVPRSRGSVSNRPKPVLHVRL